MTVTGRARLQRRLVVPWPLAVVLIVGMLTRVILVPITHGQDFTVWDLATRATLRGVNIYAHHPAYIGGPFAYFPLFLYLELPFQWLALHTGVSFTILGKLPIMAGDLVTTWLIVSETRRLRAGAAREAIAAALFFLNPLVVYNSAFYGRFDSVCLALLLLTLGGRRSTRALRWARAFAFAASVAVKTFPIVLLPWLLRRDRTTATRVVVSCVVVLMVVAMPYLLTTPAALVRDLFYNAGKLPNGVSWQVVLAHLPAVAQQYIGDALLAAFLLTVIALSKVDDWAVAAAVALLLFLVFSKQVIEQYLIWPLPFVVLLAVTRGSRTPWCLVALLTITGSLVNAYVHPFGERPVVISILFAAGVVGGTVRLLVTAAPRHSGGAEVAVVSRSG